MQNLLKSFWFWFVVVGVLAAIWFGEPDPGTSAKDNRDLFSGNTLLSPDIFSRANFINL